MAQRTKALSEANRELKQRNRELQNFAYIAAHDLQEPLRKIQTLGNRLEEKYTHLLDESARDYLTRMQNSAARGQTLVNDLLTFAQLTTRNDPFKPTDLNLILKNVVLDMELRLQETQGKIIVGTLPTIEADPIQMHQLFQNLVGNALKFHQVDTPPIVHIQKVDKPEQQNGLCYIRITDNGIGFDEKYADRIFTIFERLHNQNNFPGTGLGLAICRRIVERHQGAIEAHSNLGEGATFIISLPIQQNQTPD